MNAAISDVGTSLPRVLAVEHDIGRRRELADALDRWRVDYEFVASSPAAVATLRTARSKQNPFEVAVIGFDIPRMNGAELVAAIRDDSRISETRLLLRAADADDPGLRQTMSARGGDCLLSYVDLDALLACLERPASDRPPQEAEVVASDTTATADNARASAHTEDGPVFDFDAFSDRMSGDVDLMRTVAEVFVGDVGAQVDELLRATERADWEHSTALGHRIKGASVNIGGIAMSAQAARLEATGRNEPGDIMVEQARELQRRFGLLKAELERRLS